MDLNHWPHSRMFRSMSLCHIGFYKLVVHLGTLQMDNGMVMYLICVSRNRMITQGTDGFSIGFFMEGVMAGEDMIS